MKDVKVGQRVKVTIEGTVSGVDSAYVRLIGTAGDGVYIGKRAPGVEIEILPDLLKVGDRVKPSSERTAQAMLRGEIKFIDGNQAVVKWGTTGLNIWGLSNLQKDCDC